MAQLSTADLNKQVSNMSINRSNMSASGCGRSPKRRDSLMPLASDSLVSLGSEFKTPVKRGRPPKRQYGSPPPDYERARPIFADDHTVKYEGNKPISLKDEHATSLKAALGNDNATSLEEQHERAGGLVA